MKKIIFFIVLWASISSAFAQVVWTDHSRILPDKLRDIPTGIIIYHTPTPVYPEVNTDTVNYPGKYIWKHNTRVQSEQGDLEVVTAGSYVWYNTKGWVANVNLDNERFAHRFNCKNGVLKRGLAYTFFKNYRYGDVIYAGDALWYVIAKDSTGKLYKGIAIVETEGKLKQ